MCDAHVQPRLAASPCVSLAMSVPATAVPMSYDEPSGSYQDTCVSIHMQDQYLYAKCQDINGNWHATQLDMDQCPGGQVANNNGTLACGPGGYGIGNGLARGSWRATCRNASEDGSTLYAECNDGSGGWNSTSLNMGDCPSRLVDNSRGNLVCSGGSSYGLPRGSWRASCRNGSVEGPVVRAECNTGNGYWQQTSFDMNRCPVGALGNSHGNLVCESTRGYIYRKLQ